MHKDGALRVRTCRPLLMTGPPLYTMLPLDWACSGRLLFTLAGAPTRWRLCTRHTQPLSPPSREASGSVLCLRHLCAQWTGLAQATLHIFYFWTSSCATVCQHASEVQ